MPLPHTPLDGAFALQLVYPRLLVVLQQLGTFPLEVSLGSTLKTSRLLTRPSAPLMVSIVSICRTSTVTSKMANFVAFVAFRSTWTIVVIIAF
ncbi:hypothetical protein Tco_1354666 [Tanacetum coccineum]